MWLFFSKYLTYLIANKLVGFIRLQIWLPPPSFSLPFYPHPHLNFIIKLWSKILYQLITWFYIEEDSHWLISFHKISWYSFSDASSRIIQDIGSLDFFLSCRGEDLEEAVSICSGKTYYSSKVSINQQFCFSYEI